MTSHGLVQRSASHGSSPRYGGRGFDVEADDSEAPRIQRRGSYQPRRSAPAYGGCGGGGGGGGRRGGEAGGGGRKGGSFRLPRKKHREPEFDVYEGDKFLPVPPVNIQVAGTSDVDDEEEEEEESTNEGTRSGGGAMHRIPPRSPVAEQVDYGPSYLQNYPGGPGAVPEVQLPPDAADFEVEALMYDDHQRRRSSTMHRFDPPSIVPHQPPPQPPPQHRDQFDEYLYKSQHMASMPIPTFNPPPEVSIDAPSDSDSSRRPSKASWCGQTLSNASSYNNFEVDRCQDVMDPDEEERRREQMMMAAAAASQRRASMNAAVAMQQGENGHHHVMHQGGHIPSSSEIPPGVVGAPTSPGHSMLLAARPVLDRRSSHSGVLPHHRPRRSRGNSPASQNSPGAGGMPRAGAGHSSMLLGVPKARSRGTSLPGNMELQPEDIYRLRNFSLEGRRVVNRGDSLKARSNHSINSTGSR